MPALTAALSDETFQVRIHSAMALGAIGPPAKSAVPTLVNELLDRVQHPVGRRMIVLALGSIGFIDDAVETALKKVRHDEDKDLRRVAALTLETLGASTGD